MSSAPDKGELSAVADIVESVRRTLAPFTDPVLDAAGQYVSDRINVRRLRNLARVADEARKLLEQAGCSPSAVNDKILSSVINAALVEDDEYLQKRWAGLLAAASANNSVRVEHVTILKNLSALEARLLNAAFERSIEPDHMTISELMYHVEGGEGARCPGASLAEDVGVDVESSEVVRAFAHLHRADLLYMAGPTRTQRSGWPRPVNNEFSLTAFGLELVVACKGPNVDQPDWGTRDLCE